MSNHNTNTIEILEKKLSDAGIKNPHITSWYATQEPSLITILGDVIEWKYTVTLTGVALIDGCSSFSFKCEIQNHEGFQE